MPTTTTNAIPPTTNVRARRTWARAREVATDTVSALPTNAIATARAQSASGASTSNTTVTRTIASTTP